ncbi:MAG: amidohydrolase [Gammaproteobacteria bacterium]|nr:MAG: amidohydrolase [Gammaproteobacteria bacterium]
MTAPRRVDAHQHFWRLARGDYGWLTPELGVLYRDHEPAELLPLLAERDIAQSVLVQAAPTDAETDFLLELAGQHDFLAAVVGWVDMATPDAPNRLRELAQHPRFRGVRPMIQDIADDAWMLRTELTPAFEALIALGLRFDALVQPRHLANLLRLLERHPSLPVVIDHGAKPEIASGGFDPWYERMRALAAQPHVCCKLSGLVTEAAADWRTDDLAPYVDALFELFGAERLMWGSDWPVVNLAGGYAAWWNATETLVAGLDESDRAAVLGGTAVAFYGLEERDDD